jgi:hypothetical protein
MVSEAFLLFVFSFEVLSQFLVLFRECLCICFQACVLFLQRLDEFLESVDFGSLLVRFVLQESAFGMKAMYRVRQVSQRGCIGQSVVLFDLGEGSLQTLKVVFVLIAVAILVVVVVVVLENGGLVFRRFHGCQLSHGCNRSEQHVELSGGVVVSSVVVVIVVSIVIVITVAVVVAVKMQASRRHDRRVAWFHHGIFLGWLEDCWKHKKED